MLRLFDRGAHQSKTGQHFPGQIKIPVELAGQPQATLAATLYAQTGAAQTVNLATFAPAIFTMNARGSGQGAILDASNHLVDSSNPATPGSTVLQIFCTGLGPVSNQPRTGSPAPLTSPAYTTFTPTVTIGGVAADVSFSGLAPGYVGLYQVNARVPAGLTAGLAVPVVISMQGAASNTVTIAVE
jgi:minor extracellular serine protease Vpr